MRSFALVTGSTTNPEIAGRTQIWHEAAVHPRSTARPWRTVASMQSAFTSDRLLVQTPA
jgi:hypothetical protein